MRTYAHTITYDYILLHTIYYYYNVHTVYNINDALYLSVYFMSVYLYIYIYICVYALYYNILHSTILFYIILYYTILYYTKCTILYSPRIYGFLLAVLALVIPLTITIIAVSLQIARLPTLPCPSSSSLSLSPSGQPFLSTSFHGAAAGDNAHCSEVAVSILKIGGNAVEAAIAGVLCQGVLSPGSSGIGGGAFVVVYNSTDDSSNFIDARETAPFAAYENMFIDNPGKSLNGGLAIAVFAELKGLYLAFNKYSSGHVQWFELVNPAAKLAKRWQVTPQFAEVLHSAEALSALSAKHAEFPELKKLYCNPDGSVKEAGDWVENPALSRTLSQIAIRGPDYLYADMADKLADEIQAAGGVVTGDDIRNYRPVEHAPVKTDIMGHRLLSASGSSSGGAVVAGIIKVWYR